MTVSTYTTNMTDLFVGAGDKANATAIGGGAAGLNDETDYFIQGTGMISKNAFASAKKGFIYDCISDRASLIGTDGAFLMWTTHATPNSLDLMANGGIDMIIGSATSAYKHWYVGGSDTIEFMGWILAAVNPSETTDEANTGSPSAVEQYIGVLFDLPTGGPTKGAPNAMDAIRAGRCDLIYEFGTSTDPDASFELAVADKGDVTDRLGLVQLVNGSYFLSGLHQWGSATNEVILTDNNKTLFWRDHPAVTAPFNTVDIQNASSVINLTNISWKALGTKSPGTWVTTDNAVVNLTSCQFTDWGTFALDTNTTPLGCTFLGCGEIDVNGADITDSKFIGSTASVTEGALHLGSTTPPVDTIVDLEVEGNLRGIRLSPVVDTTYNFKNVKFTDNTFVVLNGGGGDIMDSETAVVLTSNLGNVTNLLGSSQSFTGDGNSITAAMMSLSKVGSPTYNITFKIYAHSGTYGTSSVPTGSVLAESDSFNVSKLTTSQEDMYFTFAGGFATVNGTKYVMAIEIATADAVNYLRVDHATTHGGNMADMNSSLVWSANGTQDLVFKILKNSITTTINILDGGDTPSVQTLGAYTVINNSVAVAVAGVTEGTAVKILANETVGTVTEGDVLSEGFADDTGEFSFSLNYEGAFDPSGLDVLVRARNQGIATAAIADDGGVFTDETEEGSSNATADMTLLPAAPVADDAYYFGHQEQFIELKLGVSIVLTFSGQPTIVWEYWDGDSWEPLTGVTDGTSGFETSGESAVSYTLPGDWVTTTINSQGPLYYIRARLSVLGTITQVPVGRRVTLDVTRYLPYNAERIIESGTGLSDNASWIEDSISTF